MRVVAGGGELCSLMYGALMLQQPRSDLATIICDSDEHPTFPTSMPCIMEWLIHVEPPQRRFSRRHRFMHNVGTLCEAGER